MKFKTKFRDYEDLKGGFESMWEAFVKGFDLTELPEKYVGTFKKILFKSFMGGAVCARNIIQEKGEEPLTKELEGFMTEWIRQQAADSN